jgi:nucleotide-binding universal stress UspA family protein
VKSRVELATPDIRRILCPIDFSAASAPVVDQAMAIAGWYKARILALHVYSPLFIPVPTLPPPVDRVPQTEIERMQESTRACFQAAADAAIGVDVAVDIGHPAAEILDRAATLPADLIVMGTHGAGGFERLALGSVAEKVIRKAACPVLTIPPRAHTTAVLPFKRLLCAVDFSEPSLAALAFGCSLARESGAALTLLHVIEWPWVESPAPAFDELPAGQAAQLAEFRRYLEASAMARLQALVPDAIQSRCTSQPAVTHGKPYVEILRVAGDVQTDVIIIGLHGRSAAGVMLFGSTTNQVVRRATCPVLTLRQ